VPLPAGGGAGGPSVEAGDGAGPDTGDPASGDSGDGEPSVSAPERTTTLPTRRTAPVHVHNMVTNGASEMAPASDPVVLTPVPRYPCDCDEAYVSPPLANDHELIASCFAVGTRVTNGNDGDPVDDHNPGLVESTRWYKVDWGTAEGWISEAWVRPAERGGLGLETC
jgi:hypothetical protein